MKSKRSRIVVGYAVYITAQDPIEEEETTQEGPSSQEMVEELRDSPAERWRDYLQPIIVSIRTKYGLDIGSVKLIGPRMKTDLSSPSYGFTISGHVRFEPHAPDEVREKYGQAPYRFEAHVTPAGELVSSIKLSGSER